MATGKDKSIIGDFTGRIGPIVLSPWMSIMTVRIRPKRINRKKQSAKQARQNDLFSMIIAFLRGATDVINKGFQQPKKRVMTPLNAATSFHLQNAIVEDRDNIYIDMSKVKFSSPIKTTQSAWNAELIAEEGRKITVIWELNPSPQNGTELDDDVVIIYYSKAWKTFKLAHDEVARNAMHFTITEEKKSIGTEVYCYMFLVSADGKLVSETEFLGAVTVMA